jgi:hypothetical protein
MISFKQKLFTQLELDSIIYDFYLNNLALTLNKKKDVADALSQIPLILNFFGTSKKFFG